MHDSVLAWGKECLDQIGRVDSVLEIGSHDVNGSLRPFVNASHYFGIDTVAGPGVDAVADGLDAAALGAVDLVIMTEVLEHARHWAALLMVAQACVRPGGHILISTRSPGYPWHGEMYRDTGHPHLIRWEIGDHWRFTVDQLRAAFGPQWGWVDVRPDPDPERPGVFVFAKRSRWPIPVFHASPMDQPITMERTGRSDEWRYSRRYPPGHFMEGAPTE